MGVNTAISISRVITAISRELNNRKYDTILESDYSDLLKDIIALLSNYTIHQFENPYTDSENK